MPNEIIPPPLPEFPPSKVKISRKEERKKGKEKKKEKKEKNTTDRLF